MKKYKQPKTRIKVIRKIKNDGTIDVEYHPQYYENDFWSIWALLSIISLIYIPLFIKRYNNRWCSICIDNDIFTYKTRDIDEAKLSIDKFIQKDKQRWDNRLANENTQYIKFP